jgi:hypothetical protein
MRSKRGSGAALALLSLLLVLGGAKNALALTLNLSTDKGCGSGAVYQTGETTRFFFGSDSTTNATLTLEKPDGASTLFSGTLQAGVTYVITGTAGSPDGQRTLTLTAGTTSVTCAYGVGATPPPGLVLDVHTNKGCGASASFAVGETTQFIFSADQTVSATLTLLKPDGTTTTLFNGTLQAGVPQTISGTAGQPTGTRTLTLTSGTTSVTCTYDVVSSSAVLTGSIRTNNGCGVSFLRGNPVSIIVNSSLDASAQVTLTRPDGSISVLFNGPVAAGDTTVATGTAGDPTGPNSTRTLSLTLTKPGFTTVTSTCTYDVQPPNTLSPG